jgi:hypothetical protein
MVPLGHYEFNRLPFGLLNSPSNFQHLMDTVLRNLTGTECLVYIDDVIVYSSTAQEHARRLSNVLQCFEEAILQLHPDKRSVVQPQAHYLGFTLSDKGISTSQEKFRAVRNYPKPTNIQDVRAFLGLASFYRKLLPKFMEIAKPLTNLTRKDQSFDFGSSQQIAFDTLKERLCNLPVLAYPDFKVPFILTTDASKTAIGVVLSQVQGCWERLIAYASCQLNTPERIYTTSEAEMLALVWAIRYF